MPSLHRVAGTYFMVQALATLCWWALLLLRPEYRIYFQPDPASSTSLLALWLPDLLLMVVGSLVASIASFRGSRQTIPALWLAAGGVSYATLYSIAGALIFGSGWLGVLLMAPAMLVSVVLALALTAQCAPFRRAREGSRRWNLAKTGLQIVLFWGVLLFLIPSLLIEIQIRAGIPLLPLSWLKITGALLFLAFSALGLWSGATMARLGEGTPLPLDGTRRLVIRGPYALIRNPMVVAGLGQGAAVAIYTGSVVVLAYVLLGGLIWQYIVRPLEEEDLRTQFGAEYERYQRDVRCWCPAPGAFRPGPPAT